jgi:hypothetical protein
MTIDAPDAVYDLRALRGVLPDDSSKLRKSIDRWIAAHSVHSDLSIAHAQVTEALYLHRLNRTSSRYAPIGLLHSALSTYARSLERHSNHRPAIKLGEIMSASQIQFHKQLIEIRDEGIAHFGPAGPDRPLAEDHAIVIFQDGQYQPGILSRRSLFNKGFAVQFQQHLMETTDLVAQISEERRISFQKLFHAALDERDDMASLLDGCIFDQNQLGQVKDLALGFRPGGRVTIITGDD